MDDEMKRKLILDHGSTVITKMQANLPRVIQLFKNILTVYALCPARVNKNKFICGTAAEYFLMDCLGQLGFSVEDRTHEDSIDVSVGGHLYSIKTSVTDGDTQVILKNFRGNKNETEYVIPNTFLLIVNKKQNIAYIMYLTNHLIQSIEYPKEKVTIKDSNISLSSAFLKHLRTTLKNVPGVCITIPIPSIKKHKPICVVGEFLVPHVYNINQEDEILQNEQHAQLR